MLEYKLCLDKTISLDNANTSTKQDRSAGVSKDPYLRRYRYGTATAASAAPLVQCGPLLCPHCPNGPCCLHRGTGKVLSALLACLLDTVWSTGRHATGAGCAAAECQHTASPHTAGLAYKA